MNGLEKLLQEYRDADCLTADVDVRTEATTIGEFANCAEGSA